MAEIGALSVKITSDTSELHKGLKGAQIAIRDGAAEVRNKANQWGKWATAAITAAAAVATAMTKHNLSQIKELNNFAQVANTSVEALQQQAYATDQVGVSVEKYTDILKDMNDRVGDFINTGGGPMLDFFEQIAPKVGVTADQFQNLSGPDALQLYVSSLEKANLSQADMTFYMEAIASDSTRLLPLLKDNGKAMGEAAKRAKELGIGLSEIEVAQAIEAQKALDDSAAAFEVIQQKASIAIAPYITEIMKLFGEAGMSADDFASIVGDVFDFALKAVGVFADGVRGIHVLFRGAVVAANLMNVGIAKAIDGLRPNLQNFARSVGDLVISPLWHALNAASMFSDGAAQMRNDLDGVMDDIFGKKEEGDFLKSQRESLGLSIKAFDELATKEIPSETIAKWAGIVKKGVDQAKAVVETQLGESAFSKEMRGIMGGTTAENAQDDKSGMNDEAAKMREETTAIIEALAERHMLEEESITAYYDRINAAIDAGEAAGTLSKEKAAAARKQIADDEQRFQIDTVTSTMGDIASALSIGGKKSQKIAKKIAIAKAIISGGQAAVDAWKAGMSTGGPWAPAVAAAYTAASLARTGAQINAIKGGRSPSRGGGTPSTPTQASQPVSSGSQQQGGPSDRRVTLDLVGNPALTEFVRNSIIPTINEAVGDGVTIAVGG